MGKQCEKSSETVEKNGTQEKFKTKNLKQKKRNGWRLKIKNYDKDFRLETKPTKANKK